MIESSDYLIQEMVNQFRQELWPLILSDPAMTTEVLEQMDREALPIFQQGVQRLVDSGDGDMPDTIPRLLDAVSELAAAVKEQIGSTGDAAHVARTPSTRMVGTVHDALSRICPLFPFC